MLNCLRCGSKRILGVGGKCSDLCDLWYGEQTMDGYVPEGLNIGGGDYIEFRLCLECGQVQDQFPVPEDAVTNAFS